MKKILIFSLAYFPRVGGAEVAIKEITDRLPDIEFHMVTLRFDGAPHEEQMGNVYLHRIGSGSYLSKMLFAPRAALAGARLQRIHHFDGMWAMMSYMLLPVMLMSMMGVRIPYALTLQEGDTESHMFGRLRVLPLLPLINYGFRNAAAVQAISTYLGAWARRRGFTGPLEIIPNGVDTKRFARGRSAGEPQDRPVLITTSRLVRKNGVDTIIRALPHLPGARLRILGTGPDRPSLQRLANDLHVENQVEFLGHVKHADIPEHLHAADVFVRPSRSEGMGNSFIEAMAAGLPVIATQEGGIADFLFDAKRNPDKPATGWAVDVDAPEHIAEAVKNIVGNTERTKQVVETARAMMFEKYDWNLVARDMHQKVFARVLQ